jgi:YjjG family noncanonical pyrimidine nucleotidase
MRVEVILFDADGTLFDFQRAERRALKEAMASFDLACDEAVHPAAYARINRELWQQLEQGRVTGAQLKVERFRRFLDRLGASIAADAFSREYLLRLAQGTFLIDGAEDLLAAVRMRFKLAIVTNGLAEVQRPRLARSAIGSSFDTVVVSEEVGVAKPDVGIFRHALRELRHDDPSTVLMVGDSLESDIRGGIDAGMHTCWFNPSGLANDTAIEPTCEVASLSELRDRLADVSWPSASRS